MRVTTYKDYERRRFFLMTDENLNKDGNVGTENNVSDTGVKRREGRIEITIEEKAQVEIVLEELQQRQQKIQKEVEDHVEVEKTEMRMLLQKVTKY